MSEFIVSRAESLLVRPDVGLITNKIFMGQVKQDRCLSKFGTNGTLFYVHFVGFILTLNEKNKKAYVLDF
jgi:hypothetical protein